MWTPDGYTYNEFSVFGLKIRMDLQGRLKQNNPDIEQAGTLYAIMCVLDPTLDALPPEAIPLDEDGQILLRRSIVECFGRERVTAFVRAGRTLVLAARTDGTESEEEFSRAMATCAMELHYSIEDCIGTPTAVSVSPVFDCFGFCEQVACETLTAADFVRFIQLPTPVVTPQYCANVKEVIEKRNPNYHISNYERPIISALLNGNLAHAERVVNDLLTAHLMDPLHVFPSIRSNMINTMRMCQSICCPDPRACSDENPQLPPLQKAMAECPADAVMRTLIHEYFELLDNYARQHRDTEAHTDRMNKILKYISKNVANPLLGAPMVCDEFNMSTTHFSRIFKENLGVNFSVYLATLRITKAKKLLLESDMNLNAIAQEVGYISSQNLLRLFKRYEGVSPSAYRQMAGGRPIDEQDEE